MKAIATVAALRINVGPKAARRTATLYLDLATCPEPWSFLAPFFGTRRIGAPESGPNTNHDHVLSRYQELKGL